MSSGASAVEDDHDLDPAAFLRSVRELSEKREREDNERYRKLEQEIEQSRKERALRRAERARSISPQKPISTTSTPIVSSSQAENQPRLISTATPPPPSVAMTDGQRSKQIPPIDDVPEFHGFGRSATTSVESTPNMSKVSAEHSAQSSPKTPTATSLARSGTLSWQQRKPAQRGPLSRPQSLQVTESNEPAASTAQESSQLSRDQIAASLGSRDLSWFKQTAERGIGNAALRKSSEEQPSKESVTSGRRVLPGMSRETSTEPERKPSPLPSESVQTTVSSRIGSGVMSDTGSVSQSTTMSSRSGGPDLKSLIAADESQERASPMSTERIAASSVASGDSVRVGRPVTMSVSQAKLAAPLERPASPTKGIGGFVQSAMLKRSDSVSKRWSSKPGISPTRQNSTATHRGGQGGLAGSHSMPKLEPSTSDRLETNVESRSRSRSKEGIRTSVPASEEENAFAKPALPHHTRAKSVVSNYSTTADERPSTPPASPGKRWSPTKSTWLESAIAKPDSPKPTTPRNSQPSWMADIMRAKAQRASVDVTDRTTELGKPGIVSPMKPILGQTELKAGETRTPSITASSTAAPGTIDELAKPAFSISSDSDNTSRLGDPANLQQPFASSSTEPEKATATLSATGLGLKPKPTTSTKPQTDFRSQLRSRPPAKAKPQETPEFLSRVGNLRKATTQNYVAPDTLKDNITRGKTDLNKTAGPVKTLHRDEFRESLLAKKDTWKKEKEEGIVHERKTSTPLTPQKPEALAQRELIGRRDQIKSSAMPEKPKPATPEALSRHKSLKGARASDNSMHALQKQVSEPTPPVFVPTDEPGDLYRSTTLQPTEKETSKLAARFNPGLAGILARGPPVAGSSSTTSSQLASSNFAHGSNSLSSIKFSQSADAPLEDMRKGRAKGPKRRKAGVNEAIQAAPSQVQIDPASKVDDDLMLLSEKERTPTESTAKERVLPRAPPGSSAAVMMASLKPHEAGAGSKPDLASKTVGPPKSPKSGLYSVANESIRPSHGRTSGPVDTSESEARQSPAHTRFASTPSKATTSADLTANDVAEFTGFGSTKRDSLALQTSDNKANARAGFLTAQGARSALSAGSFSEPVTSLSQDQVWIKKDEEAAMRSAGLLSSGSSGPGSRDGLGIMLSRSNVAQGTPPVAGTPPKPVRSSRVVSGQLQEASSNEGFPSSSNEVSNALHDAFGFVPSSDLPLMLDTEAVLSSTPHQERLFKTVRKTVQTVGHDESVKQVPAQEEYTFFDENIHMCTHTYTVAGGPKKTEIFIWVGSVSSNSALEHSQALAKKHSKDTGGAFVNTIRQGLEPPGFMQALGGILITRRGSRDHATKQYMLRGRKHLGQIVFDEVDFDVRSLCHGYTYLCSFPVTLQETKMYLWKGASCSTDEVSAARLAAMDVSETGDIIEVDGGAEFSSFLKIFGPQTTKNSIPGITHLWKGKALASNAFNTRLYRIQPEEMKAGVFSSFFIRRPSWNNLSPALRRQQSAEEQIKVEVKELSPFTQADMEPDYVYVLDAYAEVIVIVGPVFTRLHTEAIRSTLFAQALRFAADYAVVATAAENRPAQPACFVLMKGVPAEVKLLFRQWDNSVGLWGTAGLMAGSGAAEQQNDVPRMLKLSHVLDAVCR